MAVTATTESRRRSVTDRVIRPPDPKFSTKTGVRIGHYSSAEATRILLHCFFRDAHTAIDLTYGGGRFWKAPHPPGLAITANNIDPDAPTDLHLDFRATGLTDGAHDVAIIDPPHLPYLAPTSFMARRYGTVRSTAGFRDDRRWCARSLAHRRRRYRRETGRLPERWCVPTAYELGL